MRITVKLNSLVTDDFKQIRVVFSKLIGEKVGDGFKIIPSFYTNFGHNIQIGKNCFCQLRLHIYRHRRYYSGR